MQPEKYFPGPVKVSPGSNNFICGLLLYLYGTDMEKNAVHISL